MSNIRWCERCQKSFQAQRPHQRFCSDSCRREAWAANQENAAQEAAERVRRPSREGRGTHIYVTPSEVDFLQHCRVSIRHKDDWKAQLSLGKKLVRAKGRLR